MKKIIVLTTALVITGAIAQAQKTTFGIKAGIQQSSLSLRADDGDTKVSVDGNKIGAIVGGIANIQFTDKFSVQPNLLFVYKPGSLVLEEGNVTTMSVDLPVDLLYHSNGFFIGAGPNLSYGLSSKYKPFTSGDPDVDLYKKPDGGGNAPFKRFEFGANAVMGFQFPSGLTVTTNYTRGFNSIADKDSFGDTKINTKQFGISIGYMFNSAAKAKK